MSFVGLLPATMQSMYEGNRLPTSPKREHNLLYCITKCNGVATTSTSTTTKTTTTSTVTAAASAAVTTSTSSNSGRPTQAT